MSDPRNVYGFPYMNTIQNLQAMANAPTTGQALIVPYQNFRSETKLERAQAYAADVRARRFPPVTKFTTPKD